MSARKIGEQILPFGPLMRASRCDTQGQLAELLGMSRRNLTRYVQQGMSMRVAERFCDRLGLFPVEVWGDDWLDAVVMFELWRQVARAFRLAQQRQWRSLARARDLRRERARWVQWRNQARGPHRCALDGCRCGTREIEEAVA